MTTPARLPGLEDAAPIVGLVPMGALDHLGIVNAAPVLQGTPEEYAACWAYGPGPAGGGCLMNGRDGNRARSACLFHEPENGPAWDRLRANVLLELPDGTTAITTRQGAPAVAADLGARIVGAEVIRCGA